MHSSQLMMSFKYCTLNIGTCCCVLFYLFITFCKHGLLSLLTQLNGEVADLRRVPPQYFLHKPSMDNFLQKAELGPQPGIGQRKAKQALPSVFCYSSQLVSRNTWTTSHRRRGEPFRLAFLLRVAMLSSSRVCCIHVVCFCPTAVVFLKKEKRSLHNRQFTVRFP